MTLGDPSRIAFIIGTARYTSPDYEDRTYIPETLGQIARLLMPFGFEIHFAPAGYLLDPSRDRLRDEIRQARASADLVVIYYTGHGEHITHEGYHLITTEFNKTDLPEAGVKVVDLPVWIAARNAAGDIAPRQAPTLIILDCCFAGSGAIDLLHDALLENRANPAYADLWVWATAARLQWADTGLFANALTEALTQTTVGASTHELPLLTLLDHVNTTLKASAAQQESELLPPNGRLTASPQFFPNPSHVPNVAGMTIDIQHWMSKAGGADDAAAATGYYLAGHTGRLRAAEDLIRWVLNSTQGGLAVVTGSPGTGKSTLLALLVLLSGTAARENLLRLTAVNSLAHKTASLLPKHTSILAVHARGLNVDQIAARIAAELNLTASGATTLLETLTEETQLHETTVLLDALDEASNPALILDKLLMPLVQSRIRVILGARHHISPPSDTATITIDLDRDTYQDPEALTDYVAQLLVAEHEPDVATQYRLDSGEPHPDTSRIASAIASRATSGTVESFLIARVVALALRSRHDRVDPTSTAWTDTLPAGLEDAFEEDLSHFGLNTPTALALLEALAWAHGPGMPWEAIWVPVAQALANLYGEAPQNISISDRDVRTLLAEAGAYVIEDLGPDQRSVFRPFHDILAEYLRTQPRKRADGVDITRVETAITQALLGTVPVDEQHFRRWDRAHPYLRTYLIEHAHRAERLDELLTEGGFLAVADPTTLMPTLAYAAPTTSDVVRAYRRARSQFGDNPQANTAYLKEAAVAIRARASIGETGYRPLYDTRWSSIRADNSKLTLTGHTRPLNALAFHTTIDAQSILASAGDDGTIRLWDPDTGTELGEPVSAHPKTVQALALGTNLDGCPILASAGDDGTIRLWNPGTGHSIGNPIMVPRGAVRGLAFGTNSHGQPILAYAGDDGTIRLRSPETGQPIGEPLRGHRGPIKALAFGTDSRRHPILASAGRDSTVRIWDPENGRPMTGPLRGHKGLIRAVAFGTTADQQDFLASAGDDRTIRLWDLDTGKVIGKLMAHTRSVKALCFGTGSGGGPVLASASDDHTVRLWDPDTGIAIGATPEAHRGPVRALAFGKTTDGQTFLASTGDAEITLWDPELGNAIGKPLRAHLRPVKAVVFGTTTDGRTMLASAGDDRTIRLWNPKSGKPFGKPLAGHRGPVRALAFGSISDNQPTLASAGYANVVLWNLDTRKAIGKPLKGHQGPLWALAFGTTTDNQPVLASAGNDHTIRLWNPGTGKPIGEPLLGHQGPVKTLAFGTTTDNQPVLASAGSDHTIRLWNPGTGKPIEVIRRRIAVNALLYNRSLLTIGDDEGVSTIEMN